MKIIYLLILFLISLSTAETNISFHDLYEADFGIEKCDSYGNCTYYSSNNTIKINGTIDWIFKVTPIKQNMTNFLPFINKYTSGNKFNQIIIVLVVIFLFIVVFFITIFLIIKLLSKIIGVKII